MHHFLYCLAHKIYVLTNNAVIKRRKEIGITSHLFILVDPKVLLLHYLQRILRFKVSLNINKPYKGLSDFGDPLLNRNISAATVSGQSWSDKLLIYESLYLFNNLTTLLNCLFSCVTWLSQWHVSRGGMSHFGAEGGRDNSCFFSNFSLHHKGSPNPYEVVYQPWFWS